MWLSGREAKQSPFLMDGERGHAAPAPELYGYLCIFIAVSELSLREQAAVVCVGIVCGCVGEGAKNQVLTMPQVGAAGAVLGAQGVMRGRLREDGSSLLRPAIKRRTKPRRAGVHGFDAVCFDRLRSHDLGGEGEERAECRVPRAIQASKSHRANLSRERLLLGATVGVLRGRNDASSVLPF